MATESTSSSSSSTPIKLTSSDGKTFELKQEFVKKANMLKQMLADLGYSEEEGNYPDEGIPLPSVAGEALEKIVEWLTLHEAEDPKTDDYRQMHRFNRNVKKEDVTLFDKCCPRPKLADVINAAYYPRCRTSSTLSSSTPPTTWRGRPPSRCPRGSRFP
ncbi:hypothetical protein L596_023443 [Steinernema carpocapsae]|uniref:SKP1 component POZ domain-containing protein n=1 Tax=Steinernema carpocapsae TaxID=34508 RepID=A0A4U5MDQ1_STECR|nr:hypothetical protein L596_023443 [Steinernema carpocapsae]